MRVDLDVCRRKYGREVDNLQRQSGILRGWGIFLLDCTFPNVDVLFLPAQPLMFELPALVFKDAGQQFGKGQMTFPSVTGKAFGARINLDDYDVRAPSVTFRKPNTWALEDIRFLPIGHYPDAEGHNRQVVISNHHTYQRPFLCMEGIREYHEHSQHTDNGWFKLKNDFGLFVIVEMIWRTCCMNCRPLASASIPQMGWVSNLQEDRK